MDSLPSPQKNSDLISILRKAALLRNFDETEIKELLPFIESKFFPKDGWIFQEGDVSSKLFIVKTGQVEILKFDKELQQYLPMGVFQPRDHFGEMALLEPTPRTTSARAVESSVVLSIDVDALHKGVEKKEIHSKILLQLKGNIGKHLQNTNDQLISSSLKMLQSFQQISTTLIHFFILAAIWFNASLFLKLYLSRMQTVDHVFTFLLMILFAVSAIYIIKVSGYPLSFYGLTLQKWFRYAVEGILCSIPILIGCLGLKWFLIQEVEMFKDVPFFSIAQLESNKSIWIMGGFYALTAPFQELVARGFLQSCLRNFFRGPHRVFYAILTSNLLFQMLHTAIGFWLAMISFILGIFWGMLFEHQKSLVGVSVSHAFIGLMAFFILDFNTLFQLAG